MSFCEEGPSAVGGDAEDVLGTMPAGLLLLLLLLYEATSADVCGVLIGPFVNPWLFGFQGVVLADIVVLCTKDQSIK